MGYFDVISSKMALIFKFIIGNMEGLVTLLFFKVERFCSRNWESTQIQ